MTITYRNDGGSALTGEGVPREAIPVFDIFRGSSRFPVGSTPLIAKSGNVANASAAATLTPSSTTTMYITGFEVTGSGATAALPVTVTVAGLLGGTIQYTYNFASGVLVGNTPLIVQYDPPLPASAINTAIVVTCPASGAGGTNNTVVAHGYYV